RVPNITIISPSPFSTYGSDTFSFEIDIDEPVLNTTWYSLNGGSNYTFTGFSSTINQSAWEVCVNGTVIIRFYANNSLGNTAFTEVIVYKDLICPDIVIINPSSFELYGNTTFDFEIFIDDPELDSTWYNLNGMNYSFTGFTGTIDQLAWISCGNGTHLLTFYANDIYGNMGFSEVTIQKDILLPFLSVNLPYDNQSCGPLAISFELSLTGSDIHTRWYTLNDFYMNEFTGTMGRIEQQDWDNFGEGAISIKFYANNSFGNSVMQEILVNKRLNIVSKNAYAIVIGISNYPGTSSDLNYCDNDADEVYNMLINDYNFLPSNIIGIKDSSATKSAIDNAFATINSMINPNDIFYFYYSGHGGSELTTSISTFYLNSPHPYPNNYDRTWYITASDAAYIRVHFSDFDLESGYDYLYLGDTSISQDYYYDSYTGYGTDFWSDWIPVLNDNRIYLRMISDFSITNYGFRIDRIEVVRYSNPHYLCPYDSIPSNPNNNYLDTLLDAKLDLLNCDNIYVILDSCNSGGMIPESQDSDRFIMTACRDGQVSYEDPSLQNGIFSYYLINSLDNANDQNSDGVISMEEIFSYVSSGTQSYSGSYGPGYRSHPQISDGISGQAVLYPSVGSINIISIGNQLYYSFYLYGHGTLRTLNLSVCSISPSVTIKTEEIKYQYVSPTGFGFYAGVIEMEEGFTIGGIELLTEIEGNNLISINLRYGDSDNDGLTDFFEIFDGGGLDPTNNDTDGDGLLDGDEVNIYNTDPLEVDSDSDSLSDGDEINIYGTNPLSVDSDGDGVNDYDEINLYSTNPLIVDSDYDGINDYDELFTHFTDPLNSDTDSDFVNDGDEIIIYLTDPSNNDTDNDGLLDGDEIYVYFTNPLLEDTDLDGVEDFDEINVYSTDPLNIDTDS
ncbi:MAG: caspase family protein, partial [Promethearchaeota archaeon]